MRVLFIAALPEESAGDTELMGYPIVHTGVGKVNAGWKTALAIQTHQPDLVCNFGGCGSLTVEKGSIVPVSDVYNGDMDATPIAPYSVTPFDNETGGLNISGSGVPCFTSDTFITTEKTERFSPEKLELFKSCGIFDMELYSIARVCREMGVPVVAWKWVTDDGEMTDWVENCRIGYESFKKEFQLYYEKNVGQSKNIR